MLIMSSISTLACTTDTNNYDNIPIGVENSWIINREGYYCLRLDITNISSKTIRDVQGIFYYIDYDDNNNIINHLEWNQRHTLYKFTQST